MKPEHIKDIVPRTLEQMKEEARKKNLSGKIKNKSVTLAKLIIARWSDRGYEARDAEDKEAILEHLTKAIEQFAEMDSVMTTAIDPRGKKGQRIVMSFWGPMIETNIIEMIKNDRAILTTMMEYASEVAPEKMDEYMKAIVKKQEIKRLGIFEEGEE